MGKAAIDHWASWRQHDLLPGPEHLGFIYLVIYLFIYLCRMRSYYPI